MKCKDSRNGKELRSSMLDYNAECNYEVNTAVSPCVCIRELQVSILGYVTNYAASLFPYMFGLQANAAVITRNKPQVFPRTRYHNWLHGAESFLRS